MTEPTAKWQAALLWIWVVAATAAYLSQFRDLVPQIFALMFGSA